MMKKPRLGKKQRTRQSICRAAAKLFSERSFEDVTVAQIAAAADINISTFWRHFNHKADVLIADLQLSLKEFESSLESIPRSEHPVVAVVVALAASFDQIDADMALIRRLTLHGPSSDVKAARAKATESFRSLLEQELASRFEVDATSDPLPALLSSLILTGVAWLRNHDLEAVLASNVQSRATRLLDVTRVPAGILQQLSGRVQVEDCTFSKSA